MIAARALAAALVAPIGGLGARLCFGGITALYLHLKLPEAPRGHLLAEALLGAALGLLAAAPVYAAGALGGRALPPVGRAGGVLAWGVFFAVGGPALWLGGLAESLAALPPGAWLDELALLEVGRDLIYAALLLGAPTWASHLALGLALAWSSRGGLSTPELRPALAPLLALGALILSLPALLAWLGWLWRRALELG